MKSKDDKNEDGSDQERKLFSFDTDESPNVVFWWPFFSIISVRFFFLLFVSISVTLSVRSFHFVIYIFSFEFCFIFFI